jgi:hypothetical protein
MGFLDTLAARLGGWLTREETRVYERLCRNRGPAAAQCPADLRGAFRRSVFPRRELKNIVRFTFREEAVQANRAGYFEDCLAARFASGDFGLKLLNRHGLNPDEFLEIMLEGCDVEPEETPEP